ncbi:MAG: hypothetical protein A3J48_01825 [Candidatus Doudnabacteria bacterium RIFCSPHIGHO2_02_FULL_46_11]|uniref:Prepilin-type N-terminal cleavage/methylation domain-containing protein n=1 Tax=Candidatus Doudnabacteria bacterium RIFCSPHIGHO2_02_FULL_46_11 TaxID=1817832 RepID=A0A1F5P9M6_9BACT|nr:MAG: hypothetical protein A3J48_01825 [Candidatus Doudnabacteria bacterium RIFCSPHIGHO2_02_FULL_46_11]
MLKTLSLKNSKGFSLVEVILSASIFALLLTAVIGAIIYGQMSSALSGDRQRAVFLAQEGLEAVRSIRDNDFDLLTNGPHGLIIKQGQTAFWDFTGSSDITDGFTRQIQISSLDGATKQITSTVTWPQNLQRAGSVSLASYLTDWEDTLAPPTQASYFTVDTAAMQISPTDNSRVVGITIQNSSASPIVIDRMRLNWSGVVGTTRLNNITINGASVWSGNANSGANINIANFNLAADSTVYPITWFDFNRNITGITFSIQFTMLDGSIKTVSNLTPQ